MIGIPAGAARGFDDSSNAARSSRRAPSEGAEDASGRTGNAVRNRDQ
jgi:hypothetical protein